MVLVVAVCIEWLHLWNTAYASYGLDCACLLPPAPLRMLEHLICAPVL